MTVRELIERLQALPEHLKEAEVLVWPDFGGIENTIVDVEVDDEPEVWLEVRPNWD